MADGELASHRRHGETGQPDRRQVLCGRRTGARSLRCLQSDDPAELADEQRRAPAGQPLIPPPSGLYHGILDEVELFPRVLTPAEIKGIFQAGSNGKCKATPCVPPPAEMALWLPLDETSGTTAPDIAGFPTNGTHVNGPVPTPAVVAGGLSFDGIDDYVEVAYDPSLDVGTGDLSLDAWIKTSDTNRGVMTLVDQRINPESGYVGYSLFLNNGGTLGFHLATGNGSMICSPTRAPRVRTTARPSSWPTGTGITSPSR